MNQNYNETPNGYLESINKGIQTARKLSGHMTCGKGTKEERVQRLIEELRNADAVVIGAGGASRGVCFSLAKEGAERIVIANRTEEKARLIAQAVNDWAGKELVIPAGMDVCSDAGRLKSLAGSGYLAVQATSVGLYPDIESCPVDHPDFFENASAGIDIIYNPEETCFMKHMKEAGHPAVNGLLMLLYQGIASFELWTETTVTEEAAAEVYAAMQKEMADRRK